MFRSILKSIVVIKEAITIAHSSQLANAPVGIIGVPFAKGQSKFGVQEGPFALRDFGIVEKLKESGIDVKDYGDLEFTDLEDELQTSKLKHPFAVGSACQKVSLAVQNVVAKNERCLILGGDHSIAIGTVHGHTEVHKDLCLLWVDAHADINTELTTNTGNIHGMPCSFIIKDLQKYSKRCLGFNWLEPCIRKKKIAYIGLRDVEPLEKFILINENIRYFSMKDIDRLGIVEVTNRAFDAINPTGKSPLHVSFDIDSIDKTLAPCTGTPVHGGLTIREGMCIAEEIAKTNTLSAIDLVEVNPKLGNNDQVYDTLAAAVLIVKAFFGHSRCGNLPKDVNAFPV